MSIALGIVALIGLTLGYTAGRVSRPARTITLADLTPAFRKRRPPGSM